MDVTPAMARALERNRLLRALSDDARSALLAGGELIRFAQSNTLCEQGNPVDRVMFLVAGRAGAKMEPSYGEAAQMRLDSLRAGDDIGVLSIVDDAPHSATVTAKEPSTVLAIDIRHFRLYLKANPECYRVLAGIALDRLAVGRGWLQALTLGVPLAR